MVLDSLAVGLAAVLMVLVVLALVEYARGRWALRSGRSCGPVAQILAADPDHPLSAALVRSVAVSEVGGRTILAVAHASEDAASRAALVETRKLIEPSLWRVRTAEPPPRVFPPTWYQVLAAETIPDETRVVVVWDPCARPATTESAPIVAAVLANDALDAAAACPVAAPGSSGPLGTLLARLIADLAPLLFAAFGPPGLLPVSLAVRRRTLEPILRDPIALNRPGIAFSVLMAMPRSRAVLLPLSVGTLAHGPSRSLLNALFDYLPALTRLSFIRMALVAAGTMALPVSLWIAVRSGTPFSFVALMACLMVRGLFALTWTRTTQGWGPAVSSFLLSPLRDLVAFVILVRAAARGTLRSGGRLFRIRGGGILVPVGEDTEALLR